MKEVELILGGQKINCIVDSQDGVTYLGKLLTSIADGHVLSFWKSFEEAVDGMMLTHVSNLLEKQMVEFNFIILFNDTELLGHEVDLQIFPSNLDMSFKLNQEK